MVVCNLCKRTFKTRAALVQHERDRHKESIAPIRTRRRGRGRNGRLPVRGGRGGIDVNPSRSSRAPGGSATFVGEDRLGLFTFEANKQGYFHLMLTPGISERLKNLAKAFERIRWLSAVVTVTPQAPLTVAGGYVAGFIMDPSDLSVTAAQLTASQGSMTRKFFESCSIVMPRKPDLLYTSTSGEERFSAPGSFWVVSEGNPSQNVTVVVTMRWRVNLTIPVAEHVSDNSFIMNGKVVPKTDNYNLQYVDPNGQGSDDCSKAVPTQLLSIPGYHFFRVPTFNIEYSEGTGDTGTSQAHFLVYRQEDKRFYASSDGTTVDQIKWQGGVDKQVLVPCGTLCKYVGQGNECKAAVQRLPSLKSKDSISSSKTLNQILMRITRCLETLKTSSQDDWDRLSETSIN